jgi:hypothetical protein
MNAAVLHTINQPPHFEQFPEPVAEESEGALRIDTERVPLDEVENAWHREQQGRRAVIIP